jgi:hypothetical protein
MKSSTFPANSALGASGPVSSSSLIGDWKIDD